MHNAQSVTHKMFLSFDILSPVEIRFYSFWGAKTHDATCETVESRQLAEFFYLLNGGTNFLNCCLHIAATGCTQADFVELAEAPREFPEMYPAIMPDTFDFTEWEKALNSVLEADATTKEAFYKGLDQYFADFYEGMTIFERVTDRYINLPEGTVLTDGSSFDLILQQNPHTTFMLGNCEPAAESSRDLYAIGREKLPRYLVADLDKAQARWDAIREEEVLRYENWLKKDAERAERAAKKASDKATTKVGKLYEKYVAPEVEIEGEQSLTQLVGVLGLTLPEKFAEMTFGEQLKVVDGLAKDAKAAKADTDAAAESTRLLKEFFKLSASATIEELKEWMVKNQRQLIAKGDNSERKQAHELYQTLKTKATADAKAAEKAKADAEKKEIEPTTEGTADVQVVTTATKSRKKQPTAQTEAIEVEEMEVAETI